MVEPSNAMRPAQLFKSLFYGLISVGMGVTALGSRAIAAEDPPSVLVVHSYNLNLDWTAALTAGLDESFANSDVQIFHEYLDAKRHPQLGYGSAFLDYLNQKYAETGIDLLMVSDDPGLELVLAERTALLEELPVVFLGINHVDPALLNRPDVTGVFETHSLVETAIAALQQHDAPTLIVLNDSSETGQANLARINDVRQLPTLPGEILVVNDLDIGQIEQQFQNYPADWPVMLVGQLRDGAIDAPLVDFQVGSETLRSQLPNPLYANAEMYLGHGVIGGKVLNGAHHAQQAAQLAQRILDGESVETIPPLQNSENLWMFDAQELARFDIDLADLPPASQLTNQTLSFYQRYAGLVWVTIGAFSASGLIIVLLIEVLRRRAVAAQILRENEQRYRDLAESGADLFWEIDPQLCFSYLSGELPFLQGVTADSLLAYPLQNAIKATDDIDFDFEAFQAKTFTQQPINDFTFRFKEAQTALRIFKLSGRPMTDRYGSFSGYRGILREITAEHQLSETIAYQAAYDTLTGLINRNEFDTRLKDAVIRAQRHQVQSVLCYLDLDQFKIVNDTAGHLVGDQLLAELAHLLQQSIRTTDSLGRLGGDEFGLILEGCSITDGSKICQSLIEKIHNYRFKWQGRQFNVGVSVGMVPIAPNARNPIELLSRADLACYKAKDLGRGRIYVADTHDAELDLRQSQMARIANISQAIEENRFFLVQQPIQGLSAFNNRPHTEILLRLNDESGEVISPGQFIPVAERYGLISLIDRWVLETIVKNYDTLFGEADTLVSVNLSGASLSDDRFIDFAQSLISQTHIDPHCICFEITETAAISHLDQAKAFIRAMKELGVRFALDDFGSGVSSFGYLRSLPVDYIKIDGGLIRHIVNEQCDRTIVDLINQVAHMMGMRTIAEFVEDEETLRQLQLLEVDYAQGFAIGKPTKLEGIAPVQVS